MRLRKVKNALEKLEQNTKYYVPKAMEKKGQWQGQFPTNQPLHIEIGCGKGQFITQMAALHPEVNFIAIEKYDSVLLRCLEKAEQYDLPNLKLALIDANTLEEYFAQGEVQVIYINFSDPWPKHPHRKRRLTYVSFLQTYEKILDTNGVVRQKTDNRKLFEFSLESFCNNDWFLSNISLDLHKDDEVDNITTEFEDKWSKLGPIYRLEARKKRKNTC